MLVFKKKKRNKCSRPKTKKEWFTKFHDQKLLASTVCIQSHDHTFYFNGVFCKNFISPVITEIFRVDYFIWDTL